MYEGVPIDPQSQSGPGEHHPVAVLSKARAASHAVGRLTFSRSTCARAEEATSRIRVSIIQKLAHYGKESNVRSPPVVGRCEPRPGDPTRMAEMVAQKMTESVMPEVPTFIWGIRLRS